MALTLTEALNQLNQCNSYADVQALVGQVSGKVPNISADTQHLLYSGTLQSNGGTYAWKIAVELEQSGGGKYVTVARSEVGQLLDHPQFLSKLEQITGYVQGSTNFTSLLNGSVDTATGTRVPDGLWDVASKNYVLQADNGLFRVVAPFAKADSTYVQVELRALVERMNMPGIVPTTVEGLPQQNLLAIYNGVLANGNEAGALDALQGAIKKGAIISPDPLVVSAGNVNNLIKSGMSMTEFVAYLENSTKLLAKAGPYGVGLSALVIASEANAAYNEGYTAKGNSIVAAWVAEMGAGWAAGAAAGSAAFYATAWMNGFGPIGSAANFLITMGVGIYGGYVGGEAAANYTRTLLQETGVTTNEGGYNITSFSNGLTYKTLALAPISGTGTSTDPYVLPEIVVTASPLTPPIAGTWTIPNDTGTVTVIGASADNKYFAVEQKSGNTPDAITLSRGDITIDAGGVHNRTFTNDGWSTVTTDPATQQIISNSSAVWLDGGGSLETVRYVDGRIVRITTDNDGNITEESIPNGLQTLNRAIPNIISALSFISAIQRGDGLQAFASGFTFVGSVSGNTNLSAGAGILNGVNSLANLDAALERGDTSTAVYSAVQTVSYVSAAFAENTGTMHDISVWLNGETTAGGETVVGNLSYLSLVYNLQQGNDTAAAVALVDIIGANYLGWSVPYAGWAYAVICLLDAISTEAPPEIWGTAHARWEGFDTVTEAVGDSTLYPPEPEYEWVTNPDGTGTWVDITPAPGPDHGLDIAKGTYDGMLGGLNASIAIANEANPSFQLGLIANRLPSITYRDYSGYQLTDIDPLTGEQVHPEIYYDRTGQPYNAPPGTEYADWSFDERFLYSALAREAIAPLWEVHTAALQTGQGDPMAGLTEEERAGRAGLLAAPIAAADTTQIFRPVALDLNGDGSIQTTGTTQTVAFNVDDSGYLKNTAWLSNSDGFLFLDRNYNGQVDGGRELFSNSVVDISLRGLQGMEWVDANYDGKLTAADPVWDELKVWQDADGNGVAEAGELQTMDQLGITELNYAMHTFTRNGLDYQLASPNLDAAAQGIRTAIIPEGILVQSSQGETSLIVTQVDDRSDLGANFDGVTGWEDTAINIDTAFLLANDTLAGISGANPVLGERLSITAVTGFTHGTGYLNDNGFVYYTPDANYYGEAQFNYTLQASTGQTATATVILTIQNINDAPSVTIDQHLRPIYGYDQRTSTRWYDGEEIVTILPGLGAPHYTPYTGYDALSNSTGTHGTAVAWDDPDGPNVGTLVVSDPDGPGTAGVTFEVTIQAQQGQGIVDAYGNFSYDNWVGPNTSGTEPDGEQYMGRDTYVDTYSTQPDPFTITVTDSAGMVDINGNPIVGASTSVQINAEHTGAYYPDLGSGGKKPISIDLGNDGFGFTNLNDSNIFFDINSDGFRHRTAWPVAGDGLLAFDANGNGVIDNGSEISFAGYQAGAQTDLEGLGAFDSNKDGVFSALDEKWGKFGVWQDANQNGGTDAGEFRSLNDMGITAIALASNGQFSVIDGQTVHGVGVVTLADGSTLNMADVTIEYSKQVLLVNPDGSTSVVVKPPFAPSGEVITGTAGKDMLLGNNGNTAINALEGDDVVLSGIGNDVIEGGAGNDLIYAAEGNDLVVGGGGDDVVFAGEGSDVVGGGDGHDALMGEGGNDIIFSGNGNDFVSAGEGNDMVVGGDGDDQVFGEGGNDALFGEGGNDQLFGMDGYDMLSGDLGDDVLDGGAQDDDLSGGDGNDTLIGGSGDDTMAGGAGNDTYEVDSAFDVVVEAADAGIDTVESSITYSLGENVENLTLTGTAAIDGVGNALDNTLTGNSGANVLNGGAGADTLIGGRGNDSLYGGAGNDRYVFRLGDGADTITDASGSDTLYMGGKLTRGSLEGTRVGNDMVVNVLGTTDSVTLINWFAQVEGVSRVEFGDGSFLDRTGIEGLLNRPPVANPDAITAYEDGGAVNVPTQELLANDTDPNPDDVISVISVGASAVGATVVLANGNVQYDIGTRFQELAEGQTAEDSFTYTISDRLGATASSIVNVTIVGVNDAPVTTADEATPLQEDFAFTAVGNVLANDTDVDQGTILAVKNPGVFAGTYGQLTVAADGSYEYTLDNASLAVQSLAEGQVVTETFCYEATDGFVATPSTLTVTITGTNDAPVTVLDTSCVQEDLSIVATGNVLSNDSDVDQGTVLSVADAGARQGNFGQLALNSDGSYEYVVANTTIAVQSLGRKAQVSEHFDYSVTDGIVAVPGGLDVYLNGTNDAPILVAPLADQDFTFNKMFSWQIPVGSFTDIDQGDVLDYSATLADGSPLPDWLTFDSVTQTFSGTAPTTAGYIDIQVTATDRVAATGSTVDSLSASDVLRLTISNGNQGVGNGVDAVPAGQSVNFNDGSGTSPGSPGVLSFNNNMLQGSSGDDILSAVSSNNLLDGGAGADTLSGSIGNDLLIGGAGNDTINTGTGSDIIAFNRGDGQDVVLASAGADDTLSLGGGIDLQSLSLSRSGNNLALDTGNSDQILLQDWYSDAANHSIANLQIVLSGNTYDPASADLLLNRQIQCFDFAVLAQAFDQAMAFDSTLTSWNLADTLLSAHLAASDAAALGGDLAYQYNVNGTLAGIGVTAAETTIYDANFGVAPQLLHPLADLQTGTSRLA